MNHNTTSLTHREDELSGNVPKEEHSFDLKYHPLLNGLILTTLFDYLDKDELKSSRLVCQKWNIMSIPYTRSKFEIKIHDEDSINTKGIRHFMELMNSNTFGIPFGRYKLGSFDTSKGPGQEFLQLCGNLTTEIRLLRTEDFFIENVSELLQSTPNLEIFGMPTDMNSKDGGIVQLFPKAKPKLNSLKSFAVSYETPVKRRQACPTFYEELFCIAPNISTFALLPYQSAGMNPAGLEVLETLERLDREASIENITLPSLPVDMLLDLLRKMAQKGMKLRGLNFHSFGVFYDELIQLFYKSLISLTLLFNFETSITFQQMPKLKVLNLTTIDKRLPSFVDFNNTFPSLEKFQIFFMADSIEFNNFFSGSPSLSMKSLSLKLLPRINLDRFNHILTVFPALTTFRCDQITAKDGREVMMKIWTHMPQLEKLHITGYLPSSVNMDSLVTGIPVKDIKRFSLMNFFHSIRNKNMNNRREKILKHLIKYDHRPSIRDLKNLRSLTLNVSASKSIKGSRTRKLNYSTDFTAYFGLYTIKTLRHLYVANCEFSKPCTDILGSDMGLFTWRFESWVKDLGQSGNEREIIASNCYVSM